MWMKAHKRARSGTIGLYGVHQGHCWIYMLSFTEVLEVSQQTRESIDESSQPVSTAIAVLYK